jgi:uncharacterized membrane protein
MTKIKFLLALHDKLSGLPQDDVEERLNFYSEMIEDRMEEGMPEEEAVAAVGSVDEIAAQIVGDIPLTKMVKEKIKHKHRLKAWEIVLLAVGSPIWFSLLIAFLSVVVSLYVSLWSVVISLWSVFVSLIACALYGVVAGAAFSLGENALSGLAMIGAGLICGGLSVFLFYGCKAVTKGTALLAAKTVRGMKKAFVKKEVTV